MASGQKELLLGIDKIYDLYLHQFSLLAELHFQAERQLEDNMNKLLPGEQDLHPNRRFVDNGCLRQIAESEPLTRLCRSRSISWQNDADLVRKLLSQIQQQPYYKDYLELPEVEVDHDREFVIRVIKKDLVHFELLHHFYEDKSIYWLDDWELVNKMMIKTIAAIPEHGGELVLMDLYKEDEDRLFAIDLFRLTILGQNDMDDLIAAKTKNWEIDRIALMDIIIMKMAITELLKFPRIPVKVSLNEYIELSKMYSTPKSKVFINGILDKLVEEFTSDNKILKVSK